MPSPTRAFPWSHSREGLPLERDTSPEWAPVALEHLDRLLVDHAHCEQKAASAALALIGRFPGHPGLARAMLALAQEEIHHFRQVLDRIEARGGSLTPPGPDPYVHALRDWSFRHRGGLGPLVDQLLINAFVEARSCERFRLLAEALLDAGSVEAEDLGTFYLRLADAEGRHWEVFRDLALEGDARGAVRDRLAAFAVAEAEILAARPLEPRMH